MIRKIEIFFAVVAILIVILSITMFTFMLLWNWIAVGIVGLKVITFWEAGGLLLLLSMTGGALGLRQRPSVPKATKAEKNTAARDAILELVKQSRQSRGKS